MGQPFPTQHPAVVLRSHFKLVRNLLAVAMAAVVALSAAVVIVANDDDELAGRIAQPTQLQALPNSAVHAHPRELAPGTRYDGGPDEGTRGAVSSQPAPVPERTTDAGSTQSESRIVIPQGPGGPR